MLDFQRRNKWSEIALASVCIVQFLLLWHAASALSPTPDESGHLAAGLYYWQSGRSDLYNVNPPFVRIWATLPHLFDNSVPEIQVEKRSITDRAEFRTGSKLVYEIGRERAFEFLVISRRMCAVFPVLGTLGVFMLARISAGSRGALGAAILWAFNPTVLGHGAILSCDIPAAAIGSWAIYSSVLISRHYTTLGCISAGLLLGLAILTKLSWLFLGAFWPLIGAWMWSRSRLRFRKFFPRAALFCFVVWAFVCFGYRFNRVFLPLEQFQFVSRALNDGQSESGNRFRGTMISRLPVPLPASLVEGIDQQWEDFDEPRICYLLGEWRMGGWLHYYLVSTCIKQPIPSVVLLLIGLSVFMSRNRSAVHIACLVCSVVFFVLLSLKTNMNEHVRYLSVIYPVVFTTCAYAFCLKQKKSRAAVGVLLAWSALSGFVSYPYGISYSNEVFGGVRNTSKFLYGSNSDWSHGWIAASRWMERQQDDVAILLPRWGIFSLGPIAVCDDKRQSKDAKLLVSIEHRMFIERTRGIDFGDPEEVIGCCIEVRQLSDFRSIENLQVKWACQR